MELRVASTWDGIPLADEDCACLVLRWEPEELVVEVTAPYAGDPPPDAPPGSTWQLWDYEVVELFLVGEKESYTEIELGPHGHHLVLRLEGVRNVVEREIPIHFVVTRQMDQWQGVARIARRHLPRTLKAFNAYAIRGTGPLRRYMAHAPVPGDAPDFHRIGLFPAVGQRKR